MKQYVQHKSGQGEKWEILGPCEHGWNVYGMHDKSHIYYLPKSEYIPCDPPEEWEDVTNGVQSTDLDFCDFKTRCLTHEPEPKLRIVKIDGPHNGPCFIVERKKS